MTYERTVAAAMAETTSKFRLAEALALDIPPRRRGPTESGEQSITAHLERARQEILAAGGEDRLTGTLDHYRRTALWVSADLRRNFDWVPGRSFSAHDQARMAGMSYADFVAMPKATVDTIRQQAGNAGTDGSPSQIVMGWTKPQQVQALRDLLSDEDVAEAAMLTDGPHRDNAITAVGRAHSREDLERPRPEPRERTAADDADEASNLLGEFRKAQRILEDLAALVQEAQIIHTNADVHKACVMMAATVAARAEMVKSLVAAKPMDEGLADLLRDGRE